MPDNEQHLEHFAPKCVSDDPQRPFYHFLPPANWMNDPNGAIYWKGLYHLFYQHNPNDAAHDTIHWGHCVSEDLVHWRHLPIALAPTPGGPDRDGCYSGVAVDHDGIPTLVYHGVPDGICLATSRDDLRTWEKSPQNPVIGQPSPGDPWSPHACGVWREGDTWYLLSGFGVGAARKALGVSRDACFMFRSKDLVHWEYMHLLYEPGEESDCACPDFFPLGDKHMLLFTSHRRGAQYYLGTYANHRFTIEQHGRMQHSVWQHRDYLHCGDLICPISWGAPDGRRIMIGWITEGRPEAAQRAAGWAGIMSLPRVLSLGDDGVLRIEPLPELRRLRSNHRRLRDIPGRPGRRTSPMRPDEMRLLEGVRGDCLEISAVIDPGSATDVGMAFRRSADGNRQTLVHYSRDRRHLAINLERSHAPGVEADLHAEIAPLDLPPERPLELRVFLDRSVIEVFANGRQCLTKRIYPDPQDLDAAFYCWGGAATLRVLDVWNMTPPA